MKGLLILLTLLILATSCGKALIKDGKVYECYGFIDRDQFKQDNITYEPVVGNVVWASIGISTIVLPVWLAGYNLYCPTKDQPLLNK